MPMENENNDGNTLDFKGTMKEIFEEEKPEMSQEEAIKAYKETKTKKGSSNDDDQNSEETEHLKRVKEELLKSLKRVDVLEQKIFGDKEKENIKKMVRENAKTKDERVEQVIEEPKQKQEEKERL
jgi:hypothetical protein